MMADEPKPIGRGKSAGAAEQAAAAAEPYGKGNPDPNRGSAKPLAGKCGAKLRGSKPARYCKVNPLDGKKRCRLHGGTTPAGLDSPNLKHGLRSKYLPEGLKERYDTALGDDRLMRIRDDVAMTEALLAMFTSKLKAGRPVTVKQEARILALIDNRRKLIEAEARRMKDLHLMISIDRYLTQMTVVGNIIRKHLADLPDLLNAVHEDLQRHLIGPVDAEGGDDA